MRIVKKEGWFNLYKPPKAAGVFGQVFLRVVYTPESLVVKPTATNIKPIAPTVKDTHSSKTSTNELKMNTKRLTTGSSSSSNQTDQCNEQLPSNTSIKEDPKELRLTVKDEVPIKFGQNSNDMDAIEDALNAIHEHPRVEDNQHIDKSFQQLPDVDVNELVGDKSWQNKPFESVYDDKGLFSLTPAESTTMNIYDDSEKLEWIQFLKKAGLTDIRAQELGLVLNEINATLKDVTGDVMDELKFNMVERVKFVKYR
eukprot:CAMPEP_0168521126 /NCGR_PEP_ID=MMETSP0405-20121227/8462_1 /TAXON_ID=498012 /ORGANISM="Trichosphaerium sp, Strain Am-I-7 wt" /LENGTH=254 /DNA_ID=CAMNT_0008542269 /DNA_START=355 /DNA_END=1116 /DNA_ORIENTATION=-